MTSSFDRNWIEILPHAEQHIFDAIGLSSEARAAAGARFSCRSTRMRRLRRFASAQRALLKGAGFGSFLSRKRQRLALMRICGDRNWR
jgi:hypothetical protein